MSTKLCSFIVTLATSLLSLSLTPFLLDPSHKLVNNPRPSPILTPPCQRLVRRRLLHELPHLVPDVPAYSPNRLLCVQELKPPIEPGCFVRSPVQTLSTREEQAPILDRGIQGKGLLAWCQGQLKCVAIRRPEEGRTAQLLS